MGPPSMVLSSQCWVHTCSLTECPFISVPVHMGWSVHTSHLAPVTFAPIQSLRTSHFYNNHLGACESPRCCPFAVLDESLPLGAGDRSCLVGHFKQEVTFEMVANFLRHHKNWGAESHSCYRMRRLKRIVKMVFLILNALSHCF